MIQSWEDQNDPLAALGRGERAPFEAFAGAELGTFLGFFQRLGARRPEAEDLVQDLFVKLYESATDYRPQGRFAAYAFRLAHNLWYDRGRRRTVRPSLAHRATGDEDPLERVPDEGAEPALDALERTEEVARLRAALAHLSEPHRLVFELGVVQELPYQEIAAVLDIPHGTVKSRMFHAVRKLREALGLPAEEGSLSREARS